MLVLHIVQILMADLRYKNNLHVHANSSSKLPDHSAICVDIFSGYKENVGNNQNQIVGQIENNVQKNIIFKISQNVL